MTSLPNATSSYPNGLGTLYLVVRDIAKAGNGRARRILVEPAWSYRYPPRVSRVKKPKVAAAPRRVAWFHSPNLPSPFALLTVHDTSRPHRSVHECPECHGSGRVSSGLQDKERCRVVRGCSIRTDHLEHGLRGYLICAASPNEKSEEIRAAGHDEAGSKTTTSNADAVFHGHRSTPFCGSQVIKGHTYLYFRWHDVCRRLPDNPTVGTFALSTPHRIHIP